MRRSNTILFILGALVCTHPTFAEEPVTEGEGRSWTQDPRLGGSRGKLRYRISRPMYERVAPPDVVTLKDGRKLEAYWLEVYGEWFVFYVKETGRSWLKEEVPRSEVAGVEFDTYLDRDPVEPPVIKAAKKQPVPKEELLSGVFAGKQGRYTGWKITFRSEIDKFHVQSEDATEYGVVELESSFEQRTEKTKFAHSVRAKGRYYLYAPGTVNNKEWVLVLGEMVHSEIDRSPDVMFFTETIADETFILYFSPDKNSFRLAWSNVGQWSWTPLVRVNFRRSSPAPSTADARYRSLEWRVAPESERPGTRRARPPGPTLKGDSIQERSQPETARRDRAWVATEEAVRVNSQQTRRARVEEPRKEPSRTRRARMGSWGRPVTYWNRRR